MVHSSDLRERVVAFVREGGGKSEAARRFRVSRWCVYDWLSRKELKPASTRAVKPWKLCPEKLKDHVEQYPDAYQYERARDLGVSRYAVWYGLRRLGIKKNAAVPGKKRRASQ